MHHEELTDVWVLEDEPLIKLVLDPVHLTANNTEESLAVDQHLDTVLLYCLVKSARLVHILQVIRKSRAASVLNPDTDQLWFWLIQKVTQLLYGLCRQVHGSLSWTQLALLWL